MHATNITISGNVVDDVALKTSENGLSWVSFRIASTERRWDRQSGEWSDGKKFFVTVLFYRDAAENVAASLRKGDPIIVSGRISSRQYIKDETNRLAYEVDGESVGHDLTRGVSTFERRKRPMSGAVMVDAAGMPERGDYDSYEAVGEERGDFATDPEGERVLARPLAAAS
jgi:single-strand DNA-binding protein